MGLSLVACPGGGVAKYGAPPSDDTADSADSQADVRPAVVAPAPVVAPAEKV